MAMIATGRSRGTHSRSEASGICGIAWQRNRRAAEQADKGRNVELFGTEAGLRLNLNPAVSIPRAEVVAQRLPFVGEAGTCEFEKGREFGGWKLRSGSEADDSGVNLRRRAESASLDGEQIFNLGLDLGGDAEVTVVARACPGGEP